MEIEIDLKLSIEQNASIYYDRSKKAKKKLEGAIKALNESKLELAKLEKEKEKVLKEIELELEEEAKEDEQKEKRKSHWYDKFKWFFASNGMLAVGGRDATSNDILIKKHMEKTDIVFHTEAPGSPFFLLKTEGKEVPPEVIEEVGIATASFSRSWKLGVASAEVFYVSPEQVSKEAESGEYLSKGSFMVRGKREFVRPVLKLAIGKLEDGRLMCGPLSSVRTHCEKYLLVLQGDLKKSDATKKVKHELGGSEEEIMHVLPAGGFKIEKDIDRR
jgi:predicted ribosome quality control (RQC) complex YloA/Tae2 family protein